MAKLWGPGRLAETLNEQVSHVAFCRKAVQLQKLGAFEMVRVKSIIDKEVGNLKSSRVMLKLTKRLLQVERLCSLCGLGKMII
jgi:hypothetical protein